MITTSSLFTEWFIVKALLFITEFNYLSTCFPLTEFHLDIRPFFVSLSFSVVLQSSFISYQVMINTIYIRKYLNRTEPIEYNKMSSC